MHLGLNLLLLGLLCRCWLLLLLSRLYLTTGSPDIGFLLMPMLKLQMTVSSSARVRGCCFGGPFVYRVILNHFSQNCTLHPTCASFAALCVTSTIHNFTFHLLVDGGALKLEEDSNDGEKVFQRNTHTCPATSLEDSRKRNWKKWWGPKCHYMFLN